MPEAISDSRDLTKVRAGQAGARKRWGDMPRVVRLDALTNDQRRLVVAMVEAAKSVDDEPAS
jgi:hypothetical protein